MRVACLKEYRVLGGGGWGGELRRSGDGVNGLKTVLFLLKASRDLWVMILKEG